MESKLLSFKKLGLWHKSRSYKIKVHHYEYGYEPEKELPYNDMPYLRHGKKVARIYESGLGFQMKYAIYYLR